MGPTTTGEHGRPDRVLTLADAVIAIAMTLLALDLKPTGLPRDASSSRLAGYLGDHAGQYISFAIAFALIGQFWVVHHRLMRGVERNSPALVSATLVFLFGVTLAPVVTYLQGEYSNSLAVVLYAADVAFTSITLWVIAQIVRYQRLGDEDVPRDERLVRETRGIVSILVPLLVLGLATALGGKALYFFLLLTLADVPGRTAVRVRRRSLSRRAGT